MAVTGWEGDLGGGWEAEPRAEKQWQVTTLKPEGQTFQAPVLQAHAKPGD